MFYLKHLEQMSELSLHVVPGRQERIRGNMFHASLTEGR